MHFKHVIPYFDLESSRLVNIYRMNAQNELYRQPLSETVGLMQESLLKSRETIIMYFNLFLVE